MKQTAVEWLEELFNRGAYRETIKEAFKHAKEMEKDQIIDAVQRNWLVDDDDQVSGTEYLKEEFGKE
jgi:hypothetical protein